MKLVVDNGPAPAVDAKRRAMLASVHVGCKALRIEEDDYRALLERVTGHRSAKDCDDRQLGDVLAEFERLGFQPSSRPAQRPRASSPVVRKARAIWISLYQLGAIENASEAGLETFGRRQLGVDRLQWTNEREGFRLIEALKAMAQRNGWDQRVPSRTPAAERVRLLKDRLVGAQLARLAEAGVDVSGPIAGDRSDWSNKRLESAAFELAARIHALPKTT
ncbi:gp16 family protein [Sphingomonas oryzagri]